MAAQICARIVRRISGAAALIASAAVAAQGAAITTPKPRPRGAGPANPFADFGPATGVALALDVINTVIVVYYVWRIWARKEPAAARTART
jgi:hypothetical protein